MSADVNNDSPIRTGIPTPVLATIAVLAVAAAAFFGYQALMPKVYAPPAPKNAPNAQVAFQTWAQQKYQETSGKWSKLAPQDQQRFMDASRGNGKSHFESFKQ